MLTPTGMPVTVGAISEFLQTVEFMKDKNAVNAMLQKETAEDASNIKDKNAVNAAAEAASKMAQARSLEREVAKRVLKAHTDLVV